MRTTKKVIPVADLAWEEKETSLVEASRSREAPAPKLTRRIAQVDPKLMALARRETPVATPAATVTPAAKAPKASSSKPVPPRAPQVKSPPPPKPPPGPMPPKALAVTPHRPFAIPAPLPRMRPPLPTQLAGGAAARKPVRVALPKRVEPVFEPAPLSSIPPLSGATVPAPPPSMTGTLFVDDRFFDDPYAHLDLGDIASLTGTIDVQESWLEEDEDLVEQDIAPESFWLRPRRLRS